MIVKGTGDGAARCGAVSVSFGRIVECRKVMAFEPGDAFFQRLLELGCARMILVDSIRFFHAFDIGSKRLNQEDCRENLHGLHRPTESPWPELLLGDVCHAIFKTKSPEAYSVCRSPSSVGSQGIDGMADALFQVCHRLAFFSRVDCVLKEIQGAFKDFYNVQRNLVWHDLSPLYFAE